MNPLFEVGACESQVYPGFRCSQTDQKNNLTCFFNAVGKIANPKLKSQLLYDSFVSAVQCGNITFARMIAVTKDAGAWDEHTIAQFETFAASHVGVDELMTLALCDPFLPKLVARGFKAALKVDMPNSEGLINIMGILVHGRVNVPASTNTDPRFTTFMSNANPKADVYTLTPSPDASATLIEEIKTGTCALSHLLAFLFTTLPETLKKTANAPNVTADDVATFGTAENVDLVKRSWNCRLADQARSWDDAYCAFRVYECDGKLISQAHEYDPRDLGHGLQLAEDNERMAALVAPNTYVGPLLRRSLRATHGHEPVHVQGNVVFEGPHKGLAEHIDRARKDQTGSRLVAPHALSVQVAPWLLFRVRQSAVQSTIAPGGFADFWWRQRGPMSGNVGKRSVDCATCIESENGSLFGFSDEHTLLFCSSHSDICDWPFKDSCPHRPDAHMHSTSQNHPITSLIRNGASVADVEAKALGVAQQYLVSDSPRDDRTVTAPTGKCGFLYTLAHHRDNLKLVSLDENQFQQIKVPLWHTLMRMRSASLLSLALPLDSLGRPIFEFEPSGMPDEILVQTMRNVLSAHNGHEPSFNMKALCTYVLFLQLQAASEYDAKQEWPAEVCIAGGGVDSAKEFESLPQRKFRSPMNRRFVEFYHCDGPFEMSRSIWLANAIGRMISTCTRDPSKRGTCEENDLQNIFALLKCGDTSDVKDLVVRLSLEHIHPWQNCVLNFGGNGFAIKAMIRTLACALLEELLVAADLYIEAYATGLAQTLLLWLNAARRCAAKDGNLGCAPRRSTMHFASDQTATYFGASRSIAGLDTDLPLGIKFAMTCGMIVHKVTDWPVMVRALYENRARVPSDEVPKLGDRAGSFLWTAFLWLASVELEPLELTEEQRACALTELMDIIIEKGARLDIDYRTILNHERAISEVPYVSHDPKSTCRYPWFFCASSATASPCFGAPLVAVCHAIRDVDASVILGETTTHSTDDANGALLRHLQSRYTGSTDAASTFRTSLTREAVLIVKLAQHIPNAVEPSLQNRILQDALSKTAFASFLTFVLTCLDLNTQGATELAETLMLHPFSALPPEPPEPNAAVLACINKHLYKPGGVACQRLKTNFEARSAQQVKEHGTDERDAKRLKVD